MREVTALPPWLVAAVWIFIALSAVVPVSAAVYGGNPENYRNVIQSLQPGDTLLLVAGVYSRNLPIHNLNGTAAAPISIIGPASGPRAVFVAWSCCNTVSIIDSSHVRILNLEIRGIPRSVSRRRQTRSSATMCSSSRRTVPSDRMRGRTFSLDIGR
jgi:hypothetical protein